MPESCGSLDYFRSYLADVKSINTAITIISYVPPNVVLDPSVPYYRAYLGET